MRTMKCFLLVLLSVSLSLPISAHLAEQSSGKKILLKPLPDNQKARDTHHDHDKKRRHLEQMKKIRERQENR